MDARGVRRPGAGADTTTRFTLLHDLAAVPPEGRGGPAHASTCSASPTRSVP
jgi:hypothetical protein